MDPRAKAIAHQEAIIRVLTREGEQDDKDTTAAVKEAEAAHKERQAAGALKDVTLSWTSSTGKKEKLVIAADTTVEAFSKVASALPAAVAAKAFPKPVGVSTNTLLNDYRRRSQARHTKLRNAMARIAHLRSGGM